MKFNCKFVLKCLTLLLRDTLNAWMFSNVSIGVLSANFSTGVDDQSYYLLSGDFHFDSEEERDAVYDYLVDCKNNNSEQISGIISKHTCMHNINGFACDDLTNGGDILGHVEQDIEQ